MDICGELIDNHIEIKKASDIGRLFNKSHIGTLLSNNTLQLNLLEGVFLLDEGKMILFQNRKQINFSHLLKRAVQQIPEFETKYLVYKDLRSRGHAITLNDDDAHVSFSKFKEKNKIVPSCVIAAFSERDILDIEVTKKLIQQFTKKNNTLWFALVDEEGDLTYYDVSGVNLTGDISEQQYPKGSCILLKNRLIVFDKKLADQLLQKEFFGKPFGEMLQLSFVEALYLLEKNVLEVQTMDGKNLTEEKCIQLMQQHQPDIVQRLMVFKDLKQRGLLVKTGFKFGAHFRAYTKQPDKTHAEYLIHVVEKGFTSIWAEISRAVRLAHTVNKEFVFACIDGHTIDYIKLGRLRP
ncbi:MAG TPA: tRNA-intron lyase [Thermoplasmata archaeon]|jgi:tRNA-intron endonuclease, archaea type|nr:MAG TPA: tRNA-intron lyase [Thermoplasmata archaeon]